MAPTHFCAADTTVSQHKHADPADSSASPRRLSRPSRPVTEQRYGDLGRLALDSASRCPRVPAGNSHWCRSGSSFHEQSHPDSVAHALRCCLANHPDCGARPGDHDHVGPGASLRSADLGIPCLFFHYHQHVQGLAIGRAHSVRSHAVIRRQSLADFFQAPPPCLAPLPFHRPQDRRNGELDRRHHRRDGVRVVAWHRPGTGGREHVLAEYPTLVNNGGGGFPWSGFVWCGCDRRATGRAVECRGRIMSEVMRDDTVLDPTIAIDTPGAQGILAPPEPAKSTGTHRRPVQALIQVAPPAVVFVLILVFWQYGVKALHIPIYALPTPTDIWHTLPTISELPADAQYTALNEALPGFVIGSSLGFLVAVIAMRFRFVARGVMPYAVISNSIPIIGMAPIAVALFGFDWQSKAFIVAVLTFFPMVINAYRGLTSLDSLSLQLMRSYAASGWETFYKLRLPSSLP